MYTFLSIARALSDENRVRALMMLSRGELCVCQLIEMLGLAPSTVSKHVSILRQARLVEASKRGRWMYYRLPDEDCSKEVAQALEWVRGSLEKDKRIKADAREVKRISRLDRDELCACYRK